METENMQSKEMEDEGKPPFFASWNKLYILVLTNLVFLIAVFYAFMKYFE
jgi:hypothetical protein